MPSSSAWNYLIHVGLHSMQHLLFGLNISICTVQVLELVDKVLCSSATSCLLAVVHKASALTSTIFVAVASRQYLRSKQGLKWF